MAKRIADNIIAPHSGRALLSPGLDSGYQRHNGAGAERIPVKAGNKGGAMPRAHPAILVIAHTHFFDHPFLPNGNEGNDDDDDDGGYYRGGRYDRYPATRR